MSKPYFNNTNTQPVFNCSHCFEYQSHTWGFIYGPIDPPPRILTSKEISKERHPFNERLSGVIKSTCNHCDNDTFWLRSRTSEELQIYPSKVIDYPQPHVDMPENVQDIYLESGLVMHLSLGASAALARLALEKLLDHLEYNENTLFDKIKGLEKRQDISSTLKQKLHIVRKIGNTGAHVGTISFEEKPDIPKHLMTIINDIVDELITKPKTLEELKSFIGD